jgi:hypothetical protein
MEVSMKKQGLVLAMLAMALTFGLVLAGCGEADDGDDDSGGLSLSDFVGTYEGTGGAGPKFTANGTTDLTLTVTADSLIAKSGETVVTTIPSVTTPEGGDVPGNHGKWLYLVADGKKIGIAYMRSGGPMGIWLGEDAIVWLPEPNIDASIKDAVEDGAITGSGWRVNE